MTGRRRYDATFANFASANPLNYVMISTGIDLYGEDIFKLYEQYYEPARLGIPKRFGDTLGLRHYHVVIKKVV
jgi:hypothetical protein